MSGWCQIAVRGSEDAVRAFVAAFEALHRGAGGSIHGRELELEESQLSLRLKDLFAGGSHHLVFAPEPLAQGLAAALEASAAQSGLALVDIREVVLVRLRFSAAAFSPEAARDIKGQLLAGLPPGVSGEGIAEREERDPAAHGAELYTPEHAYTYKVSGAFSGPLPGIAEMRRRAKDTRFVRVWPLEIETRALAAGKRAGA